MNNREVIKAKPISRQKTKNTQKNKKKVNSPKKYKLNNSFSSPKTRNFINNNNNNLNKSFNNSNGNNYNAQRISDNSFNNNIINNCNNFYNNDNDNDNDNENQILNGSFSNVKTNLNTPSYTYCITRKKNFNSNYIGDIGNSNIINSQNNENNKSKININIRSNSFNDNNEEMKNNHSDLYVYKYNSTSKFRPYYEYLPVMDKSEFVFSFSEEEIAMFKDTGITDGIGMYHRFLDKALQPVEEKLKKFAKKQNIQYEKILEEFKNNFILVGTRNFGRPNCFYDISTMVPFLDLLNHSDKNNTHWYYDEKKGGYILIAIRDIEKNEEITDSYGVMYNSYLYKTYGFVIPGNINHDNLYVKINGESINLNVDNLDTTVSRLFQKLIKQKNLEFDDAKNLILHDLNDKKNYYLQLKTNRFALNVIFKEHLDIINEFINYTKNYNKL
jgi:hypothetical protein